MARGRSPTPRSSSPFSFQSLLPVLHPPRHLKRLQRPPSIVKLDSATPATPTETMPPIRNRRRRSSVTLPNVENLEGIPQLRHKRKSMVAPLPLSPRALNTELARLESMEAMKDDSSSEKHVEIFESSLTEPSSIDQIFSSPRSPTLELSFDEEIPPPAAYHHGGHQPRFQAGNGFPFADEYAAETEFEDIVTQLEEMTVRAARSRAQQRERASRRWESLCNARIRFLKEQAAHALIFSEIVTAATRPPLANPTSFSAFGTMTPIVPSSPAPASPFQSHGAPLTRMRSPSPYVVYGETIDLAAASSASGREELEALCGSIAGDLRPLVDRMIDCLHRFDYDDISVDGLTEAECRQLRTESRKRRRLDRQRAFELGVLLELKRRQIGRSRSSSASSSDSSTSSSSSESECDQPATPPIICCPVQTVDHLVAKMVMKRNEQGQRHFTSSVAAREVFEARGCSSLRTPVLPVCETRIKFARKRSHSTKPTFSDIFSLSEGAFGLGSVAWLKEKRRLAALDVE
ncbi:hypothetical protein FRC09_014542 [Ceratobasidium sp. 395]|nr:hypothetical protein FRC09_014542 [Ceratobasidium sp. 395]